MTEKPFLLELIFTLGDDAIRHLCLRSFETVPKTLEEIRYLVGSYYSNPIKLISYCCVALDVDMEAALSRDVDLEAYLFLLNQINHFPSLMQFRIALHGSQFNERYKG